MYILNKRISNHADVIILGLNVSDLCRRVTWLRCGDPAPKPEDTISHLTVHRLVASTEYLVTCISLAKRYTHYSCDRWKTTRNCFCDCYTLCFTCFTTYQQKWPINNSIIKQTGKNAIKFLQFFQFIFSLIFCSSTLMFLFFFQITISFDMADKKKIAIQGRQENGTFFSSSNWLFIV